MSVCEKVEQAARYHDGEMSPAERTLFAAHLEKCETCRLEVEWLRRLSHFLGTARSIDVPARLCDRLHANIAEWRARAVMRTAEVLAVAAALALAICAGWLWRAQSVRESPVEIPAWEMSAISLRPETAPAAPEQQIGWWIVRDLSAENGHD